MGCTGCKNIEVSYDNKYVCTYNESEIIAQLNDFIKKKEIQDSFFEINDSLKDNIYDLLKNIIFQ